ncbi:MAG TPA: hypothetical protein VD907_04095 [Verrucomicrobiae bacterium]|nr:hypothetical protein [Verrucomicrobiae bacterium]
MLYDYWQRQEPGKALFPDIEWSKPEQKTHAGRLAIIGGNSLGFAAVVGAHEEATRSGIGTTRILLPNALKKNLPKNISEVIFVPTNTSGGFSKDAEPELHAAMAWASVALYIGDTGRNSETAVVLETLLRMHATPTVITRDAIDLLKNAASTIAERPQTLLVLSFAQLQKLFQTIYYPKVLTFSMQLANLVEALHKFTITYPVTIATLHNEQLVMAHGGQVVTMSWHNPMAIWRGSVASRMATYWAWFPERPLEATAGAVVDY